MANIMDLISSWKTTVKNNQNISTLYMAYQVDVNCPQKCGFERNETSVLKGTSERLIFFFTDISVCGFISWYRHNISHDCWSSGSFTGY